MPPLPVELDPRAEEEARVAFLWYLERSERAAAAFEGPNPDRGGGAGLELVRAWSQIADYRRRRGRNRVVLVVAAG